MNQAETNVHDGADEDGMEEELVDYEDESLEMERSEMERVDKVFSDKMDQIAPQTDTTLANLKEAPQIDLEKGEKGVDSNMGSQSLNLVQSQKKTR